MSELIAIIDYGAGNLKSAEKAFQRAARDFKNPPKIIVTSDPEQALKADRLVLPGVGAFAHCLDGLLAVSGMREALQDRVVGQGAPFLGICVGMQLMAEKGLEKGAHKGIGWIAGSIELMAPRDPTLKIPHMGWNSLRYHHPHPLFENIPDGPDGLHAYFVHSYHFNASDPSTILATTDYGGPIVAAVGRDNMVGTQFHPEKSQKLGLTLIENFMRWRP